MRTSILLVAFASTILLSPLGCGGSDASTSTSPTSGGSSGASSGGTSGTGGTSAVGGAHAAGGHAGSGANGGSGGNGGGAGGASAGGAGGKGIAGSAGSGEVGGGGGKAGGAGTSSQGGGGSGGAGGSGGSTTGCKVDADCKKVPATTPPNCAHGVCDPTAHSCTYAANDADHDGHGTSTCSANDGSPITLGDDCDDTDPNTYPGSWDGPKGDGMVNRCDGIDENCDGLIDNQKLSDGTSCICSPKDVQKCSQDSSGKAITWPTGTPTGSCQYGAQTCLANGTWGPCTGAVAPSQEVCDHMDNDCNGVVDDGPAPDHVPTDAIYFAYDGDDDDHAGTKAMGYPQIHACAFDAPVMPPAACTSLPVPCALGTSADQCCPQGAWKPAAGIPQDDCDDRDPSIFPGAPENCSTPYDDNCNGTTNEGCACTPGESVSCSATSNGMTITWPAGMPVGACAYGSEMCAANGQYGQCNGAVAPAGADSCVTKGDDANCNGTPNDGCACIASPADPSYTESCSEEEDGTPIDWPAGSPVGACKAGTATCQANGSYGQCVGAIAPKSGDDCTVSPAIDTNCDGKISCPCAPIGPTGMSCAALLGAKGSCAAGTVTCGTTGYSCSIAPAAKDTCDAGNDANCDGVANEGCACVNGQQRTCGACSAGIQVCSGGAWGACSGAPGNIGAYCNVNQNNLGSCVNGGSLQCDPSDPAVPKCVSFDNGVDVTDGYGHSSATHNGSWDWNCDGTTTVAIDSGCTAQGHCPDPTNGPWTDPNPTGDCNGNQLSVENAACATETTQLACFTYFYRSCGFPIAGDFGGDDPDGSQCGKPFDFWFCEWSGGKCIAEPGSYAQYTSTCD